MAKDVNLEKNSPELEKSEAKSESKSKGDKGSKDKGGKPKKKKKGIVKYFKDAKSEFKKVVWPTPKETTRNTIVVLVMCLVSALFIFGLDSLFGLLNKLAFH